MNRFLAKDDKIVDWDLNKAWWSRPFEYYFAINNIKKNDIVLDAGCGIEHPLKFKVAEAAKEVYALDQDSRILDIKNIYDNLHLINTDMLNIDRLDLKQVDKILCISVLEHIPGMLNSILNQFAKIIKPKTGRIILTIDYPMLDFNDLICSVVKNDLEFVGDIEYEKTANKAENITCYNLQVYTAILKLA